MSEFENMPVNETPEAPETPETSETPAAPETPEAPEAPKAAAVDLDYILKPIAAIQADTALLKETLEKVSTMEPNDSAKICAMGDMITTREATNQQLLAFYQKLYEDTKPVTPTMQWVHNYARGAKAAAQKATRAAGKTAKDLGGKVNGWFKELSEEDWDGKLKKQLRKPKTRSLKEKVMDILQDPLLDEESREMLLDHIGLLKDLSPELQDQALNVLINPELEPEEKDRILENLDAIDQLDD